MIAYVCFLKDAHSVFLCRLFDDLFYFAEIFVESENALFRFKREMDRKPCGDWALAFGIALKAFSAKGVFGGAKAFEFQLFFSLSHLDYLSCGTLQDHRSLCKSASFNTPVQQLHL